VPHLAYVLNAFANERLDIQKADRSVQLVLGGPEIPGAQRSALSTLINRTSTTRDPRVWSEVQERPIPGERHCHSIHFHFSSCISLGTASGEFPRPAAAGVKLDELPVLVGKRDLAARGKER